MSDKKDSSEWDVFQARQQKQDRDADVRSRGRLKVVVVLAVGVAVGCVAYLLLGPSRP